ncbi:MAG: peptidylprolyl isomerase [Bacteroides sp.]|nr:peptidylprolyl isomerase [Bacteroides sp.]
MKRISILLTLAVWSMMIACTGNQQKSKSMNQGNETLVRLETTEGNITVKLYDETPKHRDNFIKLAKEGVYDSTLFHRVIKNFMIQAGDPQSKTASDTATLGSGDVGYTLPAEINPKFFHKRGVLAAARLGDEVNPNRESSGCQFYIVTGRKFSEAQMINMENQMNEARLENIFNELARKHMKEIYKMRKANDTEGLLELQDSLEAQARAKVAKEPALKYTKEQISAYTTIGGAPHLDGAYTIFGEVTEGMDIVDKIEKVKTNRGDRPEKDIRILKAEVLD